MDNFNFIKTEDGSIGLYNKEVDDIYHSIYGAYTEALEKFIYPSGILDYVKNHDKVDILDICYGIGYNTKAAIAEIKKINPRCDINIVALENDIDVILLSGIISYKKIPNYINYKIQECILNSTNISPEIFNKDFFNKKEISAKKLQYFKKNMIRRYKYYLSDKNKLFLHNIYYHYISSRIKNRLKINKNGKINIIYKIGDARQFINKLNFTPDFVFHDGFTPLKQPLLWTYEFVKELKNISDANTVILTYSKSTPYRNALFQNGFVIGDTIQDGRTIGTIASINERNIKNKISEFELGLLNTNSGVMFHDKDFSLSSDEILQNRHRDQKELKLQSTSSYRRSYEAK